MYCLGIYTWEIREKKGNGKHKIYYNGCLWYRGGGRDQGEARMDFQISGDIILLQLGSVHMVVHFIIPL